MIRLQCPGCDKILTVKAARAGSIGTCPACQTRFQIPDAVEEDPAPPTVARRPASSRPRPEPSRNDRDDDQDDREEARVRKRRRRDEDDEDRDEDGDRDDERPRRKRKGRKKSSAKRGLYSGFTARLIDLGVLTALAFGLSLVWSGAALLLILGGSALLMGSSIWFLVVAFQDSATEGLLCLFVPFYAVYYIYMNFSETKNPLMLYLLGLGQYLLGAVVIATRGLVIG